MATKFVLVCIAKKDGYPTSLIGYVGWSGSPGFLEQRYEKSIFDTEAEAIDAAIKRTAGDGALIWEARPMNKAACKALRSIKNTNTEGITIDGRIRR